MRKYLVIFCLMLVFLAVGCRTVVEPRVAKREGMDCEETYVTGSRIPQTFCSTAEQREERELEDQMDVERMQRSVRAKTGD